MTPIFRVLTSVALAATSMVATGAQPRPQRPAPRRAQFVITKGKDTVAVETFSRDPFTLTSEITQVNGPRTQYTMDLKPDSSIRHVELTRLTRAGQSIGISMYFLDTLVKASYSTAGESEQMDFPARRATPFLVVSFALCEQIVQAAHLDVGKSVRLTAFRMASGDTAALTVTRFHADSALLSMPDLQVQVALSATGEVIGGRHLGQGWTVERKNPR
jgi:hypothetical protein